MTFSPDEKDPFPEKYYIGLHGIPSVELLETMRQESKRFLGLFYAE